MQRDYERDRPWRGRRPEMELWGREMDQEDWARGTYGAPEYERGRRYGREYGFGPEREPTWSRSDWSRPDWERDEGGRGHWGQDWWRRTPERDSARQAWAEGTSRETWGGPAYGEAWTEPRRSGWGGGTRWSEGGRHWHGRTPMRGFQPSDERIREDVCNRLCEHPGIDTTEIDVRVQNGEVTLEGSVDDRWEKRLAEDVVEMVPGVRDVHNQLRTTTGAMWGGGGTTGTTMGGTRVRVDMQVVGVDGERIGRVKELHGDEFLLERSMARDVFVPMRFVQNTHDDQVVLSIPAGEVNSMGWRSPELIETPPPISGTMRS